MLLASLDVLLVSYKKGMGMISPMGGSFMKSRKKVLIALLCSILIAGTPLGSMAADKTPSPPSILGITSGTVPSDPVPPDPVPPPPVTPPGEDGLLSGMTPGSYTIPSGWSLVRTQDFEGTKPSGESWGMSDGDVNSVSPHTGSKSIEGSYGWDQATVGWHLSEGHTGSFSEIYLSFYEYIQSTALFNDEFYLAKFDKNSPVFQEVVFDWFWAPGFNQPVATLYAVSQGNQYGRFASKTDTVPKGQWVQWEIHYRPNTSGNSDGFIVIYKDGSLYSSAENKDINGTADMSDMSVQAGGTYTKLVWMTDSPTCSIPSGCSTYPGTGTDYCTVAQGWSNQTFSNPKCNPIDPPLASFKRYFDDIILMKK